MRMAVSIVLFSSAIFFGPPQASSQQRPSPAQRDPQAVAILSQALNTCGGQAAVAAISDFTATGSVTYYWNPSQTGSVTIQARGLREYRIDAALPDGLHSSVTNVSASFQKNPDGVVSSLPSQNTRKLVAATFPMFYVLEALQDASLSVSYGGEVLHNGQQAHEIIVRRNFRTNADPGVAQSSISKAHIFIDPNTFAVQSMVDTAYRRDGDAGEFPHEIRLSAYQAVNGVLFPFSITEFIAGQQTMSVQLNQVVFNKGLTDSAFE